MKLQKWIAALCAACSLFIFASTGFAQETAEEHHTVGPIQVFDVKAGKVVLSVPNDKDYQKMVNSWLGSVTGLAPQLTNDNTCSYVYRVPLEKPFKLSTNNISLHVNEVFLFVCEGKAPQLLVFDEQRRPLLLLFKADIAAFIKKVGIPAT
ncbi:hypothetical protein SAMN04487969_104317 [Paenibacillus algorifonticola]|uniref:Uncharacterized protein n=1 Tax=Paenibacillus algorifonticola TaxID=684063 RepID=A0A1I2C6Y3_9BACL|nr:hypothetical protein [Paenibacillus algorifonticola]SFE64099.1 hypothetical protein SAMN04487969_104317 [Paenibacillus algorifonticola]